MAEVDKRVGSLQRRIAAGKAEPISDRERAQLEELRQVYVRRFGKEPDARLTPRSA
ncbi:hypothetical protein [Arthrobacter sp. RIT-PI-e]|uniref:hypothetical protein n=1 Tax=Arthrobacter sp. RIT-PI-e TaxID=1681197 RepID=UPI000AF35EFA|nr:hypothetical protein [Arthrobacter sp. RIT-PI-e]